MYIANEQEIIKTVDDFNSFCHFIDEKNPVLTKQNVVLGKKSAFEINASLNYKKDVTGPKYQQESYPVIDMVFKLALSGKLYVRKADEKGNTYLAKTESKNEFDGLNNFEKYLFLFETFWSKYDLIEIIRWGMGDSPIDEVVKTIAGSYPGKELRKGAFSRRKDFDPVFSYLSVVIHYFHFFGLCTFIPIVDTIKKITKYDDSIKSVMPTEFGVHYCRILQENKLTNWNIPFLKELGVENEDIVPGAGYPFLAFFNNEKQLEQAKKSYNERTKLGYIPLYKLVSSIFPAGVLNKTVTTKKNKMVKGNYVFKVSLGKSIWRSIKVSSKHSLDDLHNAIQHAFKFDNDHLYSFFMDAKRHSRDAYHSPWSDEGPFAHEAFVGELELYEGQKILYLFDYGDSWEFDIQLLKIDKDGIRLLNPQILEEKGKAPEQYYYGEEDDF